MELTLFQQLYLGCTILFFIFETVRYNYHKINSSSDDFLNWANKFKINMYIWSFITGIVLFLPDGDFIYSYIHYEFWEQFTGTCIKILTNIIQHYIDHKYGMPVTKIAPRLKILFFIELVGTNGVNWQMMLTTPDLVHFYIAFDYLGITNRLILLQDVVLIMYIFTFCLFYRMCSVGLDLIMSRHDLIYELKKIDEIEWKYNLRQSDDRIIKPTQAAFNRYRKKERKFLITLFDFLTVFFVVFVCTILL